VSVPEGQITVIALQWVWRALVLGGTGWGLYRLLGWLEAQAEEKKAVLATSVRNQITVAIIILLILALFSIIRAGDWALQAAVPAGAALN
jgi:hypothetical protein